jgi:hypothetical protein
VNPRTTGILFVLAAVLGLFVYFYEIGGEAGREADEEATKRLFPGFEAAEIDQLEFTTSDGALVQVERFKHSDSDSGHGKGDVADAWSLTVPVAFPGDALALDGMAAALASMKSESVFDTPQALDVYALGPQAAELHFQVGDARHTLRLGKKAPVGSSSYVAIGGEPAVYTISTFSVNALTKSFDEVREKRIALFDPASIDRIEAAWPGGGVTLVRADSGWQLEAPWVAAADSEVVEALLSDLSFLRAEGFVDDPASDAEIGLDPAAFSVVLSGPGEIEGEPLRLEVAIGDIGDQNERLVRGAFDTRYRVAAERLEDYPRRLMDYRFKELARFTPVDAARVELVFAPRVSTEYGDGPVTITATRGESGWVSEPETIADEMLLGMLSRLATLRATGILAEELGTQELDGVGLDPANARIRVLDEDAVVLADLRLGAVRGAEWILAQAEGNPIVYQLDPELAEHIPVSFEAFRNRFVATEATPEAVAPDEVAADEALIPDPALDSP